MKLSKKILAAVLASAMVLGSGAVIAANAADDDAQDVVVEDGVEAASYLRISDGETNYNYNTQITNILYIGLDQCGTLLGPNDEYGTAGYPVALELVVLDGYNDVVKVININPETVANVMTYAADGTEIGVTEAQISYAYVAGDNYDASAENICAAVSTLLGGIPVYEYVVADYDTIELFDDTDEGFAGINYSADINAVRPKCAANVTESDVGIVEYLSSASNTDDRMERVQAVSTDFISTILDLAQTDVDGLWTLIETVNYQYVNTSFTESQYIELANLVSNLTYDEANYINIAGSYTVNDDGVTELFYADEAALSQLIIDNFYIAE